MLPRFLTRKSSVRTNRTSRPALSGETHELRDDLGVVQHVEKIESAEDARRPGWGNVFKLTKKKVAEDNLSIVAAGVAFYVFLGLIPALGALISIYGLLSDPIMIQKQFGSLEGLLPGEVITLLNEQMSRIANQSSGATLGALLGTLLALWSGAKAIKSVMVGLNIAYHEKETRNFVHLNGTALGLTFAGTLGIILAIGIIVALPPILTFLHISGIAGVFVSLVRWPVLGLLALFGFALIYRYGPDRDRSSLLWISSGAVIGTALWLIASLGFSFYVSHFGNYNKTYGSLGAVVVLLLWFVLSAYILLLGAEINSIIEHHPAERGDRMAERLQRLSTPVRKRSR